MHISSHFSQVHKDQTLSLSHTHEGLGFVSQELGFMLDANPLNLVWKLKLDLSPSLSHSN